MHSKMYLAMYCKVHGSAESEIKIKFFQLIK